MDKDNPTQVGRALSQLGIELIAAYSPEARGRSERTFGTLQGRLPQELRLAGITDMDEANRWLKEVFVPVHNAQFAIAPEEPGSAFVPWIGPDLADTLCIQEERTVDNDNTVRYRRLALQIPADRHRHHYVRCKVRVRCQQQRQHDPGKGDAQAGWRVWQGDGVGQDRTGSARY